jgi:hypothetical protein
MPKALRTYPTKWPSILLACRKCQKKLRGSGHGPGKLKKVLKATGTHVIPVSCLKLCPKGGVTVCTQGGLAQTPPLLTVLYTPEDVDALRT